MSRRGDALVAGVHRDFAVRVDERHLPPRAKLVRAHQRRQRRLRVDPESHERESFGTVCRLGEGLRGHRACPGLRPGDDATDREPVGLHRHTQFAGRCIASHDRVRHGSPPLAVLAPTMRWVSSTAS